MSRSAHRFFVLTRVTVFVALACLIVCCKPVSPEQDARERIQFSCRPLDVTTRADASYIVDDELIANQHFAVYAWNTGASFLPADPYTGFGAPALMNQLDVTYQNNADKGKNNTYTGDYFWPLNQTPQYCYSFFAYYPKTASSGITAPTFSAGNVGVYAFTAKDKAEDMVDFCVSDVSNDVVYGTTYTAYPGTVGLSFHHALTRVQVKFVKAQDVDEDTHIYIEDAKLVNIRKKGNLTVSYSQFINDAVEPPVAAPDFGRKGTTTLNWSTDPDTYASYEISISGTDPDPNPDGNDLTNDAIAVDLAYTQTVGKSEVFLMVPQTILKENQPLGSPSPQAISFRWRVGSAPASDALLILDESVKAVGSVENAGITEWRPNMSVVYTVVIKAKPIEFAFTARIVEWGDEEGYYPIIP